jgi:hypothetical protein
MAGSSFQTRLLKNFAWLAFWLLALVPLGAAAHRGQDEGAPPAENQGYVRPHQEDISAAVHVVTQSCPGDSGGFCCCRKWPFASNTAKPMAAKTATWAVAPLPPIARHAQLPADEGLPSRHLLPSSPPRAPPSHSL